MKYGGRKNGWLTPRVIANQRAFWISARLVLEFSSNGLALCTSRCKELLDLAQHLSAGAGVVDGCAQLCASRHAVGEPGGKLLHFAGGFAHAVAAGQVFRR